MKKILSLMLVCVMLVGIVCTLSSCGNVLIGTYENETIYTTYEFKVNQFTMTIDIPFVDMDIVRSGTYKITGKGDEREIIFTFDEDGKEKTETYKFSSGKEDGKAYIVLGGVTFTKAD